MTRAARSSIGFRRVLVASALVKLALAVVFANIAPHYDEFEFLEFGRRVLSGQGPVLWRAPGYQAFVALGLALAGGRVLGVRVLQALVSCLAPYLTYRIGRERFGERAGFVAGAIVAFAPSSVAFSHLLWSESLYTVLVLLAFLLVLSAGEEDRPGRALAAGVTLGCAALTRSVGLALAAAAIGWLLLARGVRGRRLALAGALVVGSVLVVAPYSFWASAHARRLVVTDTNSGFNLWTGNNEYIPPDLPSLWVLGYALDNGTGLPVADAQWQGLVRYRLQQEGIAPLQFDAWYREQARRYVLAHPLPSLLRLPAKVAALWAPDFFLPRHLLRDWYGPTPPALALLLVLLTWVVAAVPLLLGPGCLAALPEDPFRSLAACFVLCYVAVHAISYGHARMHEPLVPLLVLAVVASGSRWREGVWRRRALPLVALAVLAWVFIAPVVVGVYVMPGPRHAAFARVLASARALPLPGAHRLAWMLAGVEEARGRPEAAERILEEPGVADRAWSLVLRGAVAERAGRAQDALRWFAQALAAEPRLYEAALGLGRVRLGLGDARGAQEPLHLAVAIRPWESEPRDLLSRAGAGS